VDEDFEYEHEDRRPPPKPRKRSRSWQAFLWWREIMEMRKRHLLRISAVEKGKSNLSAQFEKDMMERADLECLLEDSRGIMVDACADEFDGVWEWATAIKGLGAGGLLAQLLSQIDDIAPFATISKLWRFCGMAVMGGQAERCKKGEKAHYNRLLKSVCWQIADQFVRQQTPLYVDVYYEEKAAQARAHPQPLCSKCGALGEMRKGHWHCTACSASGTQISFTPAHFDARAKRKAVKIFLSHLWLRWREAEGLPVTQPYAQAILGHTNIIQPTGL